ncbi:uncharacterized protein N7482_007445 [Penicillium canariense]|uniref:Uncharacterized protein n=1 Tax=Penicillium canariense TaxID=189055 RepID=A0A9W9LKK9_9EURO|nr:uncharacterized protein N7482_007445 [Penicillium canariense]KAJ5160441.1 hypothetical protein N7482_007445 [Penicillium canariense]
MNMLGDKPPDLEDRDYNPHERLLLEEQGQLWSRDDGTDSCSLLASSLLHLTALSIFFLVGTLFGFFWRADLNGLCSRHVSQYCEFKVNASVIKEVGIEYHLQEFNGWLLKENVFRQDASPEVDAAWESLGVKYRAVRIPPQEAEESDLARDQAKIRDKYGGGYPASIKGLHHLHCLNLLRESLYYNYDYYQVKGDGSFREQRLNCAPPYVALFRCPSAATYVYRAEGKQLPAYPPEDFPEPAAPGDTI